MGFEVIHDDIEEVFELRVRGYTMRAIARELGMGRSTVSRILHGQRACDRALEIEDAIS